MSEKVNTGNPLEQFVLLAKNAKGAAAVELVKQVLEAPGVFVFGELLDSPNIQDLDNTPNAPYFRLLNLFAYGTYKKFIENKTDYPELSAAMQKKLRLLTVVSLATETKLIPYTRLQEELDLENVRDLEDLVIEGASAGVVLGKLDQKNSHFEVDFFIGRDLRKVDVGNIVNVLGSWTDTCDSILLNIENQVDRLNKEKQKQKDHKFGLEAKINEVKAQIKNQPGGDCEDPDSRMETERSDRRDKKSTKGKGLRGSSKGSFWQSK